MTIMDTARTAHQQHHAQRVLQNEAEAALKNAQRVRELRDAVKDLIGTDLPEHRVVASNGRMPYLLLIDSERLAFGQAHDFGRGRQPLQVYGTRSLGGTQHTDFHPVVHLHELAALTPSLPDDVATRPIHRYHVTGDVTLGLTVTTDTPQAAVQSFRDQMYGTGAIQIDTIYSVLDEQNVPQDWTD